MASRRTLLPRLAAFLALILLAACQETPQIDSQAATALAPTGAAAVIADQRVVQQTPQRRRHYATEPLGDGELGCDDVSKLDVGDDKCAFVRKHCHSESIINYPSLYFCYVTPNGAVLTALMLLGCVVLLALLFRIIARAADDFFSCILSQISQDLGLPPRLGGVTLLALGNGAPDLSASIAAVKSGNYQLAMGALTGAGMFVGGVVAGRIITLSGGVRARGAQLRDISTQFITVAVVTGIVASGWFTYGSVIILLSIYAAYVVVVAVADFSKRAGVEWKEVARKVSRRVSGRWTQLEMASPLLQEDHGTEAAAGSGAPSGHSSPARRHAQQLGQAQEWEPEGSGQRQQEVGLDAAQLASAGSMPFPDAHSLPIMDEAGLPGRGSSPPPAAAGAELRPFTGGGSGCVSLPDLSAAAQQRQQQEARRPARYARQSAGHHRHRPPIARFEPQVPYSDLVQMPSWEYRQRALADMAQSKSFYARDSSRRPWQRRIPEEGAEEEEEEEQQGQQQQQQGPRGGWEESSESGSSEGDGEEEGEGDVERGWARSPGRNLRRTHASGSTSSGSRGTQGSYRPPLIGAASGSGAEDRPAGAKGCFASATAAVAAAAVAAVDAEAGAAPHSHFGRRHFAERLEGEEGAELQQLDRSAASTPHNSNCHSMGSFEMSRGAADAAAAAVAEADGEAWGSAAYACGGGSAQDTRPWEDGSLEDSLEEDEEQSSQLRRCLDAVQWPVLFLLTATIPLVEVNNYRRRWFLRSLAFSPLFVAAYLHLFTWQAALAVLCASITMVTAGHLGTLKLQDKAPLWCFGTGYPIGAALVALYGFAVAAMWISLFASEIVGLLQFFGMLSKIDPSVLGVTVLAWGNSLMDYLNNTAMAGRSRGGNSMAMTACFAGPLFNMLVGLGLGFWALLQDKGAARTAVTMDPVVLVGCLFVMLNCAGLVGISLTHRQHLPAWCGGVMVGLYALYLSVVLAVIVCS